jgi:gliding motility-associated lipoprotein GldH
LKDLKSNVQFEKAKVKTSLLMTFTSMLKINLLSVGAAALLGVSLCLTACSQDYVYEQQHDIPAGQWAWRDTVDFAFEIRDTTSLYNLYFQLGAVDSFPNENVYLRLHTRFPDGRRTAMLRSFDLSDATGKPLGDCSGHVCQQKVMLQERAFFNLPGQYVITVEQFSRQELLHGIQSVGLAVEATKEKRK